MIGGLAALILLSTLTLIQTTEDPQMMSLMVLDAGGTLTVTCSVLPEDAGLFYWYKMKFGYIVQTVAAGTFDKVTLKEQFDSPRFNIRTVGNHHSLTINNINKDDEAIYLCQAGAAYIMRFINGTVLAVNDHKNQQKHVYVKQSPETASVQLGDPVTLQCSLLSKNEENRVQCPGEDEVHWFRAGSEGFHPGIIYTHSYRSDEPEERSCVYSLSKTIQNSSDAGIYYCAVVTCGEILFGEGTKVETRQQLCSSVIVLVILLLFCVIVIVAQILLRKRKPVCEHCKGEVAESSHHRSSVDQTSYVGGEAGAVNYVALEFTSRKAQRWRGGNRDFPLDSTYSGMSN